MRQPPGILQPARQPSGWPSLIPASPTIPTSPDAGSAATTSSRMCPPPMTGTDAIVTRTIRAIGLRPTCAAQVSQLKTAVGMVRTWLGPSERPVTMVWAWPALTGSRRSCPIRVLGRCGGFTSDIVDGMRWAAGLTVSGVPANANPAKVMNLSLGGGGSCSATYQNAINAINAAGAIVVVSAGNSNANAANFQPANCNGVVTVAATDRDGNRTFYSNFGTAVEISAPGGETNTNSPSPAPQNGVLSTLNSGLTTPGTASYVYYQGTSMAAPHIAGVLSLMVSLDPSLNFTQSLQILQSTARSFPAGSSCTTSTCGSGIVDAAAALNAVLNPPPTSTAGPSPTPTQYQYTRWRQVNPNANAHPHTNTHSHANSHPDKHSDRNRHPARTTDSHLDEHSDPNRHPARTTDSYPDEATLTPTRFSLAPAILYLLTGSKAAI